MPAPQDTLTIQATAVAIAGRAVVLQGEPGSGKSSLALALIDRGAVLIGDDGVCLRRKNGQLIAEPHPRISGKLEIRNVGLVDVPTTTAPVALVLLLIDGAERYRKMPEHRHLLGLDLPAIPFEPGEIAPAVRVEWALKEHGLAFTT